MVQYCFTSTVTVRLIKTESLGQPRQLSRSSWTLYNIIMAPHNTVTEPAVCWPVLVIVTRQGFGRFHISKVVSKQLILSVRYIIFFPTSNDSILLMYYKISQAYTQIYSLNKSFDFFYFFCICRKILISKLPLRHSYARTLSLSSPAPNIQSENALRLILSSSNVIFFISKAFFSPFAFLYQRDKTLRAPGTDMNWGYFPCSTIPTAA